MKKVLLLFAAILMASTGMWSETVDYLYPVYNTDGVPTSGIKKWKTASVDAIVVADASEPVTWNAGWYVVTGTNVTLSQGAICNGDVHLILADGTKLTSNGVFECPGIQVSGNGNSLAIYGQTAQSGQLEANGGTSGAGIGGEREAAGSNITINGGTVMASGGSWAAGIGGGVACSGSNITINGGTVTAHGGNLATGIGGGYVGSGSNITINGGSVTAIGGNDTSGIGGAERGATNIKVAPALCVKADGNNPPTTVIENDGYDLAESLTGKQFVTIIDPIVSNAYAKGKADGSAEGKVDGYAEGKADALGTLGNEQEGPALIVTDQDGKEVILYNPKSVKYIMK